MPKEPLIVNGWLLLYDPCFLEEIEKLSDEVSRMASSQPETFKSHSATKRLQAILHLTETVIPANPASPEFRLGNALGSSNKNWFRAKFFQQYRLFFRFDSAAKIIIYAWVNDSKTLRSYESKTDAYVVFRKMLDKGHPPKDWIKLLERTQAIEPKKSAKPKR
jgi:toxin YhaV